MRFVNPYNNVSFANTPRVMAITHEHIFQEAQFRKAYHQGVRIFACVNYYPSAPSVSTKDMNSDGEMSNFSNWKTPVRDWINTNLPDNIFSMTVQEREEYTTIRYYEGGVESLEVDGVTIYPKFIPQIANSEHASHKWTQQSNERECTHHNVLGSLFGEPTNGLDGRTGEVMTNTLYPGWDYFNEFETMAEEMSWRRNHIIYSMDELHDKYLETCNQQFDGKLFGTVNHNSNPDVEMYFKKYPDIFKALELFNSYFSPAMNASFRSRYDSLLRKGYRIFGTAVVDWIGTVESWNGTSPQEKENWTEAYNNLPSGEKEKYLSASDYYSKTVVKECKLNRGFNMLYINGYDESDIDTLEKAMSAAESGLDSYIAGQYYMTGTGVNYIENLNIVDDTVSITVSGTPSNIVAITSKRSITDNGNTLSVKIENGETYIRFEAYYNNTPEGWNSMSEEQQEVYMRQGVMDFLYTNPIWIEDNEEDEVKSSSAQKCISLGII